LEEVIAVKFSIITTCKGRLEHLRETLPSFVAQPEAEVIVVDYDCPEKTKEYVQANFPDVKIVAVDNQPKFRATHARNLGASVARGEYLAFIDADIQLAPDFTLNAALEPGHFGIFNFANDAKGTCIIPRVMFDDCEGYDEVIFGYSQEDLELYMRLDLAGYRISILPKELISKVLVHSNEMRTTYFDMGRKLAYARGKVYRDAKAYLLLISRRKELARDVRQAVWDKINQMLATPNLFDGSHSLDIPLPVADAKTYLPNSEFSGALRFTLELKK
jgi:glycosyltransferase involved in cell wall biosynthesis